MKRIFFAISAALFMFSLTACDLGGIFGGGEKGQEIALSIVLGNRANMKTPNINAAELINGIKDASLTFGSVSVITADGSPSQVIFCDIPEAKAGLDGTKLNKIAQGYTDKIEEAMSQVKAQTPETDALKALDAAKRALASADGNSIKHIIIIDSGLSTSGILNFAKTNFLAVNTQDVIDWLASQKAIPDFSGITVSWFGLGDTAYPQTELSPEQKSKLRDLWAAIIKTGGGTVNFLEAIQGADPNPADYPKVTIVNLDAPKPPEFTTAAPEPTPIVEPIVFSEEKVHFLGDKADYVNASEAEAAIKPTAEFMLANPNFTALLVGTTAGNVSTDFTYQLSRARADKVRETLIKFGVPAERILTIGLASSDPWHIPDTDNKGDMNENNARLNRKVVLLDANSEPAMEIINGN